MRVSRRYQLESRAPVDQLDDHGEAVALTARLEGLAHAAGLTGFERPQPLVAFGPVVSLPSRVAAGDAG